MVCGDIYLAFQKRIYSLSTAHRSFVTSDETWVLSFPMMASVLCLMTNPNKIATDEYADRDISWCMDSLQAFCRLESPGDGERDLSFSLGTYPDSWMYLSFALHFFWPDVTDRGGPKKPQPFHFAIPGLGCDRRSLEIDLGSFQEARILVHLRCAAGCGTGAPTIPNPATVGVVLTDLGHQPINARAKHWDERQLESSSEYSGVALFHTIVWDHLDIWAYRWDQCLDHIDNMLGNELATGNQNIRSSEAAKYVYETLRLFMEFRRHMAQAPRSLRRMRKE